MSKVDQWLKEQEKNYPTIKELKEYKTEVLLKWWLNCWGWKDPQEYQDMDWCWEKQISYFLEDPIIQTQRAIKERGKDKKTERNKERYSFRSYELQGTRIYTF